MTLPTDIPKATLEVLGTITAAQEAMGKAERWLDTARNDRDHGIALLREHGWTLDQIGVYTGLSVAAIRKISKKQGVVAYRGARINNGE